MYLREFLLNKDAEMPALDDDLDEWDAATNVLILSTCLSIVKRTKQEQTAQQTCPDNSSVETLPSLLHGYLGDMTVRDFLSNPERKTSQICKQIYDDLPGHVDLFHLSQLADICEKIRSMYRVIRAEVVQRNGHAYHHYSLESQD